MKTRFWLAALLLVLVHVASASDGVTLTQQSSLVSATIPGTGGIVVLNWSPYTPPAGYTLIGYCLTISLNDSGAGTVWPTPGSNFEPFCSFQTYPGPVVTSFTDTGVFPGDTIYFRVAAELDGSAVSGGTVTLTPPSDDFGAANVGDHTRYDTFTFTNGSVSSVTVGTVSVSANYDTASDGCSSNTITASGHCTVQARCSPGSTGSLPGTLTIPPGSGFTSVSSSLSCHGTTALTPPAHRNQGVIVIF